MYNVKRTDIKYRNEADSLMLGLSVKTVTEAMFHLKKYCERYPHMRFEVVETTLRQTCPIPGMN